MISKIQLTSFQKQNIVLIELTDHTEEQKENQRPHGLQQRIIWMKNQDKYIENRVFDRITL